MVGPVHVGTLSHVNNIYFLFLAWKPWQEHARVW